MGKQGEESMKLSTDVNTSRRMARTRGKDNELERRLRSELFRKGLRFRLHWPVPGIPRRRVDIAFVSRRIAVFIDGCFWHGCPRHRTYPKRNSEYCKFKIDQNRERDRDTDNALRIAGLQVLRVWEHENTMVAVRRILLMMSRTGSRMTS